MASKIKKVLKFGGSSVGSAERIKNICRIIHDSTLSLSKGNRIAVVVSAMQGVTDKLLALDFAWVKEKHLTAAKELRVVAPIELLSELENVIKGIKLIGDASPMALDLVASFGERLSANLITSYLNHLHKLHPKRYTLNAISVDARDLVKTDNNFQNAAVDFAKTNVRIRNYFKKTLNPKPHTLYPVPVITGFIGSTDDVKTTTIGRGGSDYSAAIFGAALGADVIEIWTDVNGIMSADPRVVKEAVTLPQVSYEEAFEMAYFGAKVLYPPTILPAIKKGIPVLIKNTFNPKHPGTFVTDAKNAKNNANDAKIVKNISSIDDVSLINVGGTNLAGVPGSAERVFKAVAGKKVNIILISQASSEHTICLAVKSSEAEKAISALKGEFENEVRRDQVAITPKNNQSIVAIVGDNMRGVPGVAGRVFNSLGRNKINISAIAQGGSERNISFVVNKEDKNSAVGVLHREFFAPTQPAIFLLGTGVVGSELVYQMNALGMKLYGVGDIDKMTFYYALPESHAFQGGDEGQNYKSQAEPALLGAKPPGAPDHGRGRLYKNGQKIQSKMDLKNFLAEVSGYPNATKILVDCTASEAIAKMYPEFVMAGCDIVTPNKKANVLPMSKYSVLRKTLAVHNKAFHYQANVGAGLPIIDTVKSLMATGDKIKKIEGIFSGTLSYLFNNYDGKRKFSALVQEAKQKGYTEPNPREDLSGQDVGRKLLILAREMGLPVELSDVQLENLADYDDAHFARRYKKAKAKDCVLRYVGTIANGKLSAKLKEASLNDPLANVQGTDNIIAIYSNYYSKNPLVIKGPGAGAEVTAAAVLAGIIKTTRNLWKV